MLTGYYDNTGKDPNWRTPSPSTIVYVPYQLMQVRPTNYTEMDMVNDTRSYPQS